MGKKSKRVRGGGGGGGGRPGLAAPGRQQQQPALPFIDRASYDRHGGNGQLLMQREHLNIMMQHFATLPVSNPWNDKRPLIFYSYYLVCKDLFDMQVENCLLQQRQERPGFTSPVPLTMNADFEFLRTVANNTQAEPVFFRALAWITLGVVSFASRDAQGQALQSFDQAFASIDSLSASEKKQIVRTEQVRHTTVGALLSRLKDHFVGILKQLDECRICTWGPTGVYMPVAIMAGSHCDCCLKPRGESVFMVCDRCALAHYCSVQCQRKAWKDHGHKMVCRKKGEFRVGDVAGSVDHFGALGVCHPVRLQAPAAGVHVSSNRSSWQVQSTLENDSSGVKLVKVMPVASLVRIRPGLWNILKRDEWEAVRENMNAAGDDDGNVPNLTLL